MKIFIVSVLFTAACASNPNTSPPNAPSAKQPTVQNVCSVATCGGNGARVTGHVQPKQDAIRSIKLASGQLVILR